jgi:tripartite-type tricarboxylate transporter receptor subunit TctC
LNSRTLCVSILTLAAFAPFASVAADPAKGYPVKPIRMVMPNAPGSAIDMVGRVIAHKLGEALGQQVLVDNRAGAGGIIGMDIGRNAVPDGYTIIFASPPALAIAPLIQAKLPFDPLKDFEFITLVAVTPNVLVVNPAVPAKTVAELIEFARAKKGGLNMASAGAGSQSHLASELFRVAAQIDSLHVPYKGGGASMAALVAGESQWSLTPAPAAMGLVRGGKLRLLAHSLPKRTALLPDVPAIAEIIPKFDYSGWMGVLAPRGTPKVILDRLRVALEKTMNSPEIRSAMAEQATEIVLSTPEEFRKVVQATLAQNAGTVKALGLKAD